MRVAISCFAIAILLATSNINAQQNRFWDEDDINPQRAGFSNSQSNGCTIDQMLEMARGGLTNPEINEKCGVSSDSGNDTRVVSSERFIKVGETFSIAGGAITIYLKNIGIGNSWGNWGYFYIDVPRRGDNKRYIHMGKSVSFDYRRRLYKLHVLDIFIDDQVAKISLQDIGPYKPR